jgi:hypothetical protein
LKSTSESGLTRFTLMLISFLLFHFGMTLIYISPKKFTPDFLDQLSQWYIAPVFDQSWALFAPDPPLREKELWYRILSESGWSDWQNPGAALLEKHDAFRLSNASILYRINQNTAWHLWQSHYQLSENTAATDSLMLSSFGYQVAAKYCFQKAKQNSTSNFQALEMKLEIGTPPPPASSEEWQFETIEFPIYVVE